MWEEVRFNDTEREHYPKLFRICETLLSLQTVVALLGNGTVMYLTVRTPSLCCKTHNYLLFALALSDSLYSVAVSCTTVAIQLTLPSLCAVGGYAAWFWGLSSFCFPAILAINRYTALYRNHLYETLFSRARVLFYIVIALVLNILILSPFIAMKAVGPDRVLLLVCGPLLNPLWLSIYYNVTCQLYIAASYVLVVYFNLQSVAKLKENRNTNSGIRSALMEETERLVQMMEIVSILPVFAQGPGVLAKSVGTHLPLPPQVGLVTMTAFSLPATLNPYITLSVVRPYRKALLALLKSDNVATEV